MQIDTREAHVLPSVALKAAQACANMGELRAAVDELDLRLVALLAVRQSYMERAATLKPRRDQVHDAARIEEVVARVVAEAKRIGLSEAIAEPVWRTLIERSIAHELEAFDGK
jgi:isochorismate pyruvate lyase